MKNGKYKEGEHVLRAKIDMSSPNMLMRDPSCTEFFIKNILELKIIGAYTLFMIGPTDNQIILKNITLTLFFRIQTT